MNKKMNRFLAVSCMAAVIASTIIPRNIIRPEAATDSGQIYEAYGDGVNLPFVLGTCIDGIHVTSRGMCDKGDLYKRVDPNQLSDTEQATIFWALFSFCGFGGNATFASAPEVAWIMPMVQQINAAIASGQGGGIPPIDQITQDEIKEIIHGSAVLQRHPWIQTAIASPEKYLSLAGFSQSSTTTAGGKTVPENLKNAVSVMSAYVITETDDDGSRFMPIGDADFVRNVKVQYSADGISDWSDTPQNGWNVEKIIDGTRSGYKLTNSDVNKPLFIRFDPEGTDYQTSGINLSNPQQLYHDSIILYDCVECGSDHYRIKGNHYPASQHQRWAWIEIEISPSEYYARVNADPTPTPDTPTMDFEVFRHTEDMSATYNVKMHKYDYETGKPLEGAVFDLYERFDDQSVVNTEKDGAVEIYEGGEPYQSGMSPQPAIWDDFRKINSLMTDTDGLAQATVNKTYHYEKTFCNGHPLPEFAEMQGNEADQATMAQNMAVAQQWLDLVEACEEKATSDDYEGVHFHFLLNGIDVNAIEEIASTGIAEGLPTVSDVSPEEAFEKSGCKADRDDTYSKFIALKYSYTFIESKARDGYILHDSHVDDVPIEVVTTDASENGANAEYTGEYSKEITINESVGHEMPEEEEDEGEESQNDENENEMETASITRTYNTKSYTSDVIKYQQDEEIDVATKSQIDDISDFPLNKIVFPDSYKPSYLAAISNDVEAGGGTNFETYYQDAFTKDSVGEDLEAGDSSLYSYPDNDENRDYWKIYDHRIEGELHFNKRDLDLDEDGYESGLGNLMGNKQERDICQK